MNASRIKHITFLVIVGLLLIPNTRKPIQILLNKGLALIITPSVIETSKQIAITDYNWKLKSKDGSVFNFSSTKNKVALVNFWATWCPPCIAEMPSLHKLYNDYDDKIEFVFISNEDRLVINKFLQEKKYMFEVYKPITPYPDTFDVSSIPRTFLISKTGYIIIDKTGAANWNSEDVRYTIDNLLKE